MFFYFFFLLLFTFPPFASVLYPDHLVPPCPPKGQAFLWKIAWRRAFTQDRFESLQPNSVLSPNVRFLCSANSESNDYLYVHCPFSWTLWSKLFSLTNLTFAIPPNFPSLISQWRVFPFFQKTKKIWNLCLRALCRSSG